MKTNTLRIIGGVHRGRKLNFPDVEGLRPTPDRVRETLFNWLQGRLMDKIVVDLFAGAGGLGFEAASRGARVTLVEKNAQAAQSLEAQAHIFDGQVTVIHDDAYVALKRLKHVDGVFIDPPYSHGEQTKALAQLSGVLNAGAWVYFEYPVTQVPLALPHDMKLLKEKKAGQVIYCLAEFDE